MKNLIVDVSRWQSNIDWPTLAPNIDAAIIKATDGATGVDKMFARNYKGARQQNLPINIYHFLRPGSGRQQAEHFVAVINSVRGLDKFLTADEVRSGKVGLLGVTVDAEWSPNRATGDADTWRHVSVESRLQTITDFILEVEKLLGCTCVIYTARTWWDPMLSNAGEKVPAEFNGVRFASRHLHIADYVGKVELPHNWTKFSIWQKSGQGHVPGIVGTVDLNELHPSITLADLTEAADAPSAVVGAATTALPPEVQPATSPAEAPRLLRLEQPFMRGEDVLAVQDKLVAKGLLPANHADKVFGPELDKVVRAFQRSKGLNADGIVGAKTLAKLDE